jgi:YHS domain-containing protein
MKRGAAVWAAGMAVAVAVGLGFGCGKAEKAAPAASGPKMQTTCPVMDGNPINKEFFADYQGKRVYFCCGACPGLFAKNPEKYMQKLKDAGVTLEDAPAGEADKTPAPPAPEPAPAQP